MLFIVKLLGLVGLFHVLRWLYQYVYILFLAKRLNLAERYGKNSWVMVTGASDGIGLAYCKAFAREGFNIVLLARNPEKLEKAKELVKQENPLVDALVIVADFSKSDRPGFFEEIANQVKDLDISILINNVGCSEKNWRLDSAQMIKDMFTTNVNSYFGMSRTFEPQLISRQKRSAVINVTSVAALIPLALYPYYQATKAMLIKFTEDQAMHLPKSNVDVLNSQPALVATSLSGKAAGERMSVDIAQTPEDHTEGVLTALGNTAHTFGATYHRAVYGILRSVFRLIPSDLVWYVGKGAAATI